MAEVHKLYTTIPSGNYRNIELSKKGGFTIISSSKGQTFGKKNLPGFVTIKCEHLYEGTDREAKVLAAFDRVGKKTIFRFQNKVWHQTK